MRSKNPHGPLYGALGALAAISACAGAMVTAPAAQAVVAVQGAPAVTAAYRAPAGGPHDDSGAQDIRRPAATPPGAGFLQKEEAQGGDCTLTVPANPLSAQGLATPYQLSNGPNTTGCTMANAANLGAFVQATILEPGGKLADYDPLVITAGTTPAAAPPVPVIPAGSVVTIDTGFQGNIDFLTGPGRRARSRRACPVPRSARWRSPTARRSSSRPGLEHVSVPRAGDEPRTGCPARPCTTSPWWTRTSPTT